MCINYAILYWKEEHSTNPELDLDLEVTQLSDPHNRNYLWPVVVSVLLIIGVYLYNEWQPIPGKDGLEYNEETDDARATESLMAQRRRALEDFKNKNKQCEQYALVARRSGYYPCTHCLGGEIYLLSRELWKYGESCSGINRYDEKSFERTKCRYVRQFAGSKHECLLKEKEMILMYPILPENLKRGKKALLLPPGNKRKK